MFVSQGNVEKETRFKIKIMEGEDIRIYQEGNFRMSPSMCKTSFEQKIQ